MTYQINKTDGTILSTVADGQIDQISSDLTLIGKNYSGFGEFINENFVKLLENFANTSRPDNPIAGQIWFDTAELKLKVYSGTQFIAVGSASISIQQPTTLTKGDLWFSESDKQLFFFDGNSLLLLGPDYTSTQGISGFKVNTILDSTNQPRTVLYLYVSGTLLGIFSKEQFIPQATISGFTGNISPGFNVANVNGFKLVATSADSDKLGGISASSYVKNISGTDINLVSPVLIKNNSGLSIGTNDQGNISIVDGKLQIAAKSITLESAITINPASRQVNIYEDQPTSSLRVGGDLIIDGDLSVLGTINETTTNEVTLTIEDKFIVLAETDDSSSTTDEYADGGGIILRGDTDHTILWDRISTAWNSSEHVNLAAGKKFKINGSDVVDSTTFYGTSIPNVTSFGIQNVVRIGPGTPPTAIMKLENNVISALGSVGLELEPAAGNNIILRNAPRITGLSNPQSNSDAATKQYVDNLVNSKTLVFSIDLSDNKTDTYIINSILNELAPPIEYAEGTIARILCSTLENIGNSVSINPLINRSTDVFNRPSGTGLALTNVSIDQVSVPAQTIRVIRTIKVFRIISGSWSAISSTSLPL